jgi:hypothetical protein
VKVVAAESARLCERVELSDVRVAKAWASQSRCLERISSQCANKPEALSVQRARPITRSAGEGSPCSFVGRQNYPLPQQVGSLTTPNGATCRQKALVGACATPTVARWRVQQKTRHIAPTDATQRRGATNSAKEPQKVITGANKRQSASVRAFFVATVATGVRAPRFSKIPSRSSISYAAITASIGTPNFTGQRCAYRAPATIVRGRSPSGPPSSR